MSRAGCKVSHAGETEARRGLAPAPAQPEAAAAEPSPEPGKRSSSRMRPGDPPPPRNPQEPMAEPPRPPREPGLTHSPLLTDIPHGAAGPGRQLPPEPDVPVHREVPGNPTGTGSGEQPQGAAPLRAPPVRPRSLTPVPHVPKAPPARARRVVFEDEVTPPRRPPGRAPPAAEGEKRGVRPVPPRLAPQPHAVPDYVARYPAIRTPRQLEGYKGVFQDQLAEYTELLRDLRDLRAGRRRPRELEGATGLQPPHATSRTDPAFLGKQQRCRYLKEKLTHLKGRIREFDRDTGTGTHAAGP